MSAISSNIATMPEPSCYAHVPGLVTPPSCDTPMLQVEGDLIFNLGPLDINNTVPHFNIEIRNMCGELIAYEYNNNDVVPVDGQAQYQGNVAEIPEGQYRVLHRRADQAHALWTEFFMDLRARHTR